jgi:hypothetical protein
VSHILAEIDDDGTPDPMHRRYRYVCRCGKAGEWRPSTVLARGDHKLHKHVAATGSQP